MNKLDEHLEAMRANHERAVEAATRGDLTEATRIVNEGRRQIEAVKKEAQANRVRGREYEEAAATIHLTAMPEGDVMRVTGPTYDVRAELKRLGGKWDATTKAWLLPRERWEQAVRRAEELHIQQRVEKILGAVR